jgi:hypothetical protein
MPWEYLPFANGRIYYEKTNRGFALAWKSGSGLKGDSYGRDMERKRK